MSIKSNVVSGELMFHDKLAFPRLNKTSVLTKYLIAIKNNPNCDRAKIQELVYGMYKGLNYGADMVRMLVNHEYINVKTISRKHTYTITALGNYHLTKVLS